MFSYSTKISTFQKSIPSKNLKCLKKGDLDCLFIYLTAPCSLNFSTRDQTRTRYTWNTDGSFTTELPGSPWIAFWKICYYFWYNFYANEFTHFPPNYYWIKFTSVIHKETHKPALKEKGKKTRSTLPQDSQDLVNYIIWSIINWSCGIKYNSWIF